LVHLLQGERPARVETDPCLPLANSTGRSCQCALLRPQTQPVLQYPERQTEHKNKAGTSLFQPCSCVAEHAHCWCILNPLGRAPGILDCTEYTLRVRHHDGDTTVLAANTRNT